MDEPPLILTVDADPATREDLARVLGREGFRVEAAGTGEEALARAAACPHLILLGVHLGGSLDGFAACRRLKADPHTAPIPVVHLTPHAESPEHRVASLESGADGYLTQPLDPGVLLASVRSLLRARAAEGEVRRAAVVWQKTFDAIADGVALVDAAGKVVRCNRAFAALAGVPAGQLCEQLAGQLLSGLGGGLIHAVGRVRASRRREAAELRAGERWLAVTCDPVLEEGLVAGVVVTLSDITARKQLEGERQELLERAHAARQAAEEANRVKDEFLATLSHELRTPVNAIVGWGHVLLSSQLEPDLVRRGLHAIVRNARAQDRLVSDILDVSRILSGKLRLEIEPTDVGGLVRAALESLRPSSDAKRLHLQAVIPTDLPPVPVDPGRLQQVLWNLVANAVKFTPAGGTVATEVACRDGQLEIVVQDDGPGIPPEFLPHVFDRFRQADASTTRRHGGLGLGLALVRHLVEMHGGQVEARSEGEGKGARFTVRLSLAGAAVPAASSPAPSDAGAG